MNCLIYQAIITERDLIFMETLQRDREGKIQIDSNIIHWQIGSETINLEECKEGVLTLHHVCTPQYD